MWNTIFIAGYCQSSRMKISKLREILENWSPLVCCVVMNPYPHKLLMTSLHVIVVLNSSN